MRCQPTLEATRPEGRSLGQTFCFLMQLIATKRMELLRLRRTSQLLSNSDPPRLWAVRTQPLFEHWDCHLQIFCQVSWRSGSGDQLCPSPTVWGALSVAPMALFRMVTTAEAGFADVPTGASSRKRPASWRMGVNPQCSTVTAPR